MITAYALLLARCGLSQRDAVTFHNVRPDTVKSWSSGRNRPSQGVIAELRTLYARIENTADEALAVIGEVSAEAEIELGLASDDIEAKSLGWPCVGAHAAVLGIVAARCDHPVRIVPRGSTAATAAAADIHDHAVKSAD